MGASETDAAIAEISVRGGLAATTIKSSEWPWAFFWSWCELRGVRALPADEKTVLNFVGEHRYRWSWGFMRNVVTTIGRAHIALGYPSPCGPRVSAAVRELRRGKGSATAPLVDAVSMAELQAMVFATRTSLADRSDWNVIVGAATVVAWCFDLELPRTDPATEELLASTTIKVHGAGDLVLHRLGSTRLLLGDRHRVEVDYLVAAAERGLVAGRQVAAARGETVDMTKGRCGWDATGSLCPGSWSDGDRSWFLSNLDPSFPRRSRDAAYLLVGSLLALRHKEIAELGIAAVTERPDGYLLSFASSKTDQYGQRPPRALPHAGCGDDAASICPACALRMHLRVVAARGRINCAVFATYYGGELRTMTTQNGTRILRTAWRAAGLAGSPRLSSRTLRTTGATAAYDAGMRLEDIAARVTLHASYDETRRYVRSRRPDHFDLDI